MLNNKSNNNSDTNESMKCGLDRNFGMETIRNYSPLHIPNK